MIACYCSNNPLDQTYTYLDSGFLHYTNGCHAGWRALSPFAFVPHNLFNRVCPLCVRVCVFRLWVFVCVLCAYVFCSVFVKFYGFDCPVVPEE